MLEVNSVTLNFDRPVLSGINFLLKEGEIFGIVGKSGAGKTSLLKIMSGTLEPTAGTVELMGQKVRGPLIKLVPGHPEIQLVNQDFHLDTYHTVEENIREQILYLPIKERNQLIEELLDLVELTNFRNQKATTLSGGEQQRLALARALACEPRVLLLDEPFVHLDGRLRSKLISYLLELRKIRKTSFVLVSHDGAEMLGLADRIFCMKKGKFYRSGNPKDLYYKPKSIEEARLFGAVNSLIFNNKRVLFRPDEFIESSQEAANSIRVIFQRVLFTGPVYESYFLTEKKEKIVLFDFKSLENVEYIRVEKKI